MNSLNAKEKKEYLTAHLCHRMTLLRTLRERRKKKETFQGQGDIYRCVKDSNLIAVRLLMDFMGLKGEKTGSGHILKKKPRLGGPKYADDVMMEKFIGRQLTPDDVPPQFRETLAGVYCRADKELAHLTKTFDDKYNTEEKLIEAATTIENLLANFLFGPLGFPLPAIDE